MSLKHLTGNAALDQLRNFARYQTHGGYVWAAVLCDGDLLCEKCVLANYRAIYKATKATHRTHFDDAVMGLANSGEFDGESPEYCAGCNKCLWGEVS